MSLIDEMFCRVIKCYWMKCQTQVKKLVACYILVPKMWSCLQKQIFIFGLRMSLQLLPAYDYLFSPPSV